MYPKPIIIANLGYKQKGHIKQLRNLCKYLQYRDGSVRRDAFLQAGQGAEVRYPAGVSDYVKPVRRAPKWVDKGMGETYHQIADRAWDWQGRYTLARTWVLSPDPELMKHIPEDKRFALVRNVTESTVERWYSDNGWGQAEYSYVIHDKQRSSDGEQMAHAHVITPGTVPVDAAGELGRVDHIVRKAHICDLHRTAEQSFEQELGRVLGRDRGQALIAERNARIERERQPQRARSDRMGRLHKLGDIMQLMQAEKASRQAKKDRKKNKRRARQRQAELRMYARYVREERSKRRDADRIRAAAARQQAQRSELTEARARHHSQLFFLKEKGIRMPTHAEVEEQAARERRAIGMYFMNLFDTRDAEKRERQAAEQSHERER